MRWDFREAKLGFLEEGRVYVAHWRSFDLLRGFRSS